MRHSNSGRKFSRSPSHRKAMFMNLAKALIIHGRITTTEMRAKDLRGVVERLVTLAKRNDLHARRLAYRELNDHSIVKHLFDNIGPIFAETPGGYTRILKLAKHRKGDNAPMAIIEFSITAKEEKKQTKSNQIIEKQETPKSNLEDASSNNSKNDVTDIKSDQDVIQDSAEKNNIEKTDVQNVEKSDTDTNKV